MSDKIVRCPGCGAEMTMSKPHEIESALYEHGQMIRRKRYSCYLKCDACKVWETNSFIGDTRDEAKKLAYEAAMPRWEGKNE